MQLEAERERNPLARVLALLCAGCTWALAVWMLITVLFLIF